MRLFRFVVLGCIPSGRDSICARGGTRSARRPYLSFSLILIFFSPPPPPPPLPQALQWRGLAHGLQGRGGGGGRPLASDAAVVVVVARLPTVVGALPPPDFFFFLSFFSFSPLNLWMILLLSIYVHSICDLGMISFSWMIQGCREQLMWGMARVWLEINMQVAKKTIFVDDFVVSTYVYSICDLGIILLLWMIWGCQEQLWGMALSSAQNQ